MTAKVANVKTAPVNLSEFHAASPQGGGYEISDNAKRASVPEISDSAKVTRGAKVSRKGVKTPVLIVTDGSARRALELSAVGAAISGGVLSRAEVLALLGD